MNTKFKWIVGGDEILKQFVISRLSPWRNNGCARDWVTRHGLVVVFKDKEKAKKHANTMNKRNE